ncbi:hypothetical protein BKA56DRAFT_82530 [Ilyonectria sp. MPI-CAGE-AT-0026]|nr:hypothetical protein BKA56DRAFT_82530 [Ilyonectria sp. MPI-CAGE-AT-0026]
MRPQEACLPLYNIATTDQSQRQPTTMNMPQCQQKQIEDFPTGYPQFTALLSSHPYFHVFRKFSRLRTRMLLNKQDELARLEEQLEELDRGDACPLFRGSFRRDRNPHRMRLYKEIGCHLVEYDDLVERTEKALQRPAATELDTTNVRNWVAMTGQIPRDEASYLWAKDLAALGMSGQDPTFSTLGALLDRVMVWASDVFRRAFLRQTISRNSRVYIFSKGAIEGIARFITTIVLLALLFIPIAVALCVSSVGLRVLAAFFACSPFILALSAVTKARTAELFVAGATYSALLVVFITGSS